MPRPLALVIALLGASLASFLLALVTGTFPISAREVLDSLLYPTPGVVHDVIWRLRAPRAAAAFCCGGLVAAAGALPYAVPAGAGNRRRVTAAIAALVVAAALAVASQVLARVAGISDLTAASAAICTAGAGAASVRVLRSIGIVGPRWVLPLALLGGGSLLTLAGVLAGWPRTA